MKPRTLAEKQEEKARLLRKAKAARRSDWAELIDQEPRLIGFQQDLRRSREPRSILTGLADSWVRLAPMPVRYAVLRLIDRHASKQARFAGRAPLDDPLPPQRNLYLAAREMLAVR